MSNKSIFTKIIEREIPAKIAHEDDLCIVIHDINPRTPVHLLVIPKEPIISLAHLSTEHQALMGHMMLLLKKLADDHGLGEHFKTQINTGVRGGQEVFHLHIHLMGTPV
jgi:histidine triad (HIT) family protein